MDYRALITQSLEELRLKTAAHDGLWHVGQADWSVDQDAGEIVFDVPNGMVVTCPVQIIGTFNSDDSTWLWAWDHPSVESALRQHAQRLREYGEAIGIADLTTRKLAVTEEQCWEFTALASKLNDAQGGYRGPSGSTLIFMTFGQPQIKASDDERDGESSEHRDDDAAMNFTADIPPDVRDTVAAFIAALHDWEIASNTAYEKDGSAVTMKAAQDNYAALIRKWCVADLQPQSISFGNDPAHHREAERLVSMATTDNGCRVRTQHTKSTGFVTEYEYHLRREDGQWLVENLYYVDDGEKFEML